MFHRCKNLCLNNLRLQLKTQLKCMSVLSRAEVRKRRSQLFEDEKKKQRSAIGRIEKIDVKYETALEEIVLVMNKNLSTPYECCGHLTTGVRNIAALALVNGEPWDMCKPLTDSCTLRFVNLKNPVHTAVNVAFWRTCSFLMGAMIDSAFKDDITVHLHSFPYPVIRSGSFVYDAYLDLPSWNPSNAELQAMSASFVKLANAELLIEPLEVTESVALEMFQENPYKMEQIPNIARDNNNSVTVYRVGDHVDISRGPMVGNTRLIGRVTIAAVHKVKSDYVDNLYRFQGVALPAGIVVNYYAYNILEQRAKKLNEAMWMPQMEGSIYTEDNNKEDNDKIRTVN